MKRIFLLFSFALLLLSCRKESPVNLFKSTAYFYSSDHSIILYDATDSKLKQLISHDYKELDADVESFEVLAQELGKDKKFGYYKHLQLKNVDAKTFYWDEYTKVPKDANHVYLPGTETEELPVIPYADPATYEKVSLYPPECFDWYVDKNYYYYSHVRTGADVHTMTFESVYFPFDKKYIFYYKNGELNQYTYKGKVIVESQQLVRDDCSIFYTTGCEEKRVEKIECKDPTTFKYYDWNEHVIGIDDKIYIRGIRLAAELLDRATFEWLEDLYSKDKGHVYYETYVLEGADATTFEVMGKGYAKDKNKVYKNGAVLEGYEPKTFEKDEWGQFPDDRNFGKEPSRSSGGGGSWGDDD